MLLTHEDGNLQWENHGKGFHQNIFSRDPVSICFFEIFLTFHHIVEFLNHLKAKDRKIFEILKLYVHMFKFVIRLVMDHCPGQFSSKKIMKIFKTECTKKSPKICTGCRVSTTKIYLYHSTKIAKARPHRVVSYRPFCPEAVVHGLVQSTKCTFMDTTVQVTPIQVN